MPSMHFHSQPGPSLLCPMSSRCSLQYGRHLRCLCHLAVILPRLPRRHKPHKNSGEGQILRPPEVIGPEAEQGTGPEARPGTRPKARPGAEREDGRIEGRTELGLLQ